MKQTLLFLNFIVLLSFPATAQTSFGAETGEYASLLKDLERNMFQDQEMEVVKLNGRERTIFVPWIRDHVHVMKAMKFLHPDMTSFLEFYLENQTPEGLYYDYYFPLKYGGSGDRKNIFDKRYWKVFPEEKIEMHRLPVEADLEYLLVEGLFYAWQATGDVSLLKKWLPTLVKGITYSMTDPLRWSTKHQLVKRGYTLDTWDFMQLPTTREEYSKNGGNIQKGIFDIDENTPMGIMHGDNSGMYQACTQLAEMFSVIGNEAESRRWEEKAIHFKEKTNALCWNDKFYAHFIEDDPQPSYLKMDQKNTLSLSNPYDVNRGLPTEAMAQSIIETYLNLKETNRNHSIAEWYGIYPPVEPHFADYKPGSYMNGGVNTIVGGELAKAAFQHGYEKYGVDILNRISNLIKTHNGKLPVSYTPEGKVDAGIPDNWGQAAVYSAMIEGLAGVVDKGTQFKEIEVSPRWIAAGKNQASVNVTYKASGATLLYDLKHTESQREIEMHMKGPFNNARIRMLIPNPTSGAKVLVNKKTIASKIEKVRDSIYIVFDITNDKSNHILIQY
jgi:hypothetical protein